MSNLVRVAACAALGAFAINAHASGFFFFIPGSVMGKIGDALTGATGEQCVAATAKVGDVLTAPSGNKATIKSLSGTSSRCARPELPIRADVEFKYTFSPKAGMELPDGFDPVPVTDFQRFTGFLLRATGPARMGLAVAARPKAGNDVDAVANAVSTEQSKLVDDYKVISQEHLEINGIKAARFEAEGKNKGVFGPKFNYIVTVLDGASEVVVVNAWAPSKDGDFTFERETLRKLAHGVKGLTTAPLQVAAPPPVASTPNVAAALQPGTIEPVLIQASSSAPAPVVTVPVTTPGAIAPRPRSAVERLRELDELRNQGLVNDQEFEAKRKAILQEL